MTESHLSKTQEDEEKKSNFYDRFNITMLISIRTMNRTIEKKSFNSIFFIQPKQICSNWLKKGNRNNIELEMQKVISNSNRKKNYLPTSSLSLITFYSYLSFLTSILSREEIPILTTRTCRKPKKTKRTRENKHSLLVVKV